MINLSSDFPGWNDDTTEFGGATGEYLGRHGDSDGNQSLYKTFDFPEADGTVTVEFDILEIDDWKGSGSIADELTVFVNDQPVLLQSCDANVDDGETFIKYLPLGSESICSAKLLIVSEPTNTKLASKLLVP